MSAFPLCFCISCFFFHTQKGTHTRMYRCTQSLPLDQNSPGNLWMHQPMPQFWAVHSQLPLAAVKSQCLRLNATKTVWAPALFRGIYCGLSSGSLQPFTALGQSKGAISAQLSVQRSPQPAALGLWHLPPSHQQGEARVPLLPEVPPGRWNAEAEAAFALCSWKVLRGCRWDSLACTKTIFPFRGLW